MTTKTFDIVVIGAGPGGYVAAIRAAQLGMSVACVEQQYLGGTCLNVGCIPSKALLESSELFAQAQHKFKDHGIVAEGVQIDFAKLMERKNRIVRQLTSGVGGLFKKNKITHIEGKASLTRERQVNVAGKEDMLLSAKAVIIATGSTPIQIPTVPFDGKHIVDSTGALALEKVPQEMIVIGGGYIGLEMGSVYMRLGSKVTVIEAFDRILPGMDAEMGPALQKILSREGMNFLLGTKVQKAEVNNNRVTVDVADAQGKTQQLSADVVLVAVGRKPNTDGLNLAEAGVALDEKGRIKTDEFFRTSAPNVYAIGDVIAGPMLAHKASEEGVACVENMAGHKAMVNYNAIPGVVYTWPEVASVGLSEEEAKAKNIGYKVAKFPMMANGRALSMGEKDGFVKLIADKANDKLIGAHIIAPRASDLIAELVLGMEFSATAEDIALTIHAHPTLSEAVKEAALGLGSGIIHL